MTTTDAITSPETLPETVSLDPYRPLAWFRNGHLQTIIPSLFRRPGHSYCRRERIATPDGDFVDLDVTEPAADRAQKAVVLLVHGLEGSSSSSYIQGTANLATARGYHVVALNQRGCSGEANALARSYHSGLTEDLLTILAWIEGRYPEHPIGIVGFSLGANQTLKLMGEDASGVPEAVRGAVGVSPPFSLHAVKDRLDSSRGVLYRYHFLRTLVAKALRKARRFPGALSAKRVRTAMTSLREYDHVVTAPLHGFTSAEDYYDRASCGQFVGGIARDTLILTSLDDPIIPGSIVPHEAIAANPKVSFEATRRGGHVGFVTGGLRSPRYWAEEQAIRWLAPRLA